MENLWIAAIRGGSFNFFNIYYLYYFKQLKLQVQMLSETPATTYRVAQIEVKIKTSTANTTKGLHKHSFGFLRKLPLSKEAFSDHSVNKVC